MASASRGGGGVLWLAVVDVIDSGGRKSCAKADEGDKDER